MIQTTDHEKSSSQISKVKLYYISSPTDWCCWDLIKATSRHLTYTVSVSGLYLGLGRTSSPNLTHTLLTGGRLSYFFNFLVTFASWLFHMDNILILLSKHSNSNWFCRPVYKLLLQIEDPLFVRWFISIFVEQSLTTSIVVIIFMLKGVSGRLDDNYLVHKLEQGCLLDLENCHIKEEVVIISRRSSSAAHSF